MMREFPDAADSTLWPNLWRYWKSNGGMPSDLDVELLRGACTAFCNRIRDWKLSRAEWLGPAQNEDVLNQVRFIALAEPRETVELPDGSARIFRPGSRKFTSFGGWSAETLGEWGAYEMQREVRIHLHEGQPLRFLAVYLPPHAFRFETDPLTLTTFSRMRISYAKGVQKGA